MYIKPSDYVFPQPGCMAGVTDRKEGRAEEALSEWTLGGDAIKICPGGSRMSR